MTSFDFDNLDTLLVFRSRPEAIPSDFRPIWRICLILLILQLASRSQKSSISKIQILNWAIRSKESRESLLRSIDGKVSPDTIALRIEPSLNRAIDLAQGEGLIEFVNGKNIQLTWHGGNVVKKLLELDSLFTEEKSFLLEIGKSKLTEQTVISLFAEGQ